MRVISVNVGRPQKLTVNGRQVLTSIYKQPVNGTVKVGAHNLEGDQQSDLRVHGGPNKAVYVYPAEHYEFWRDQFPEMDLPWGSFGENLTTEGLLETSTHVGDRMQIGTAEFQVTQPREPCFKLALRMGREDMVKRFVESGRSGFYLRVTKEGRLGAGDDIAFVSRDLTGTSVSEMFRLKTNPSA